MRKGRGQFIRASEIGEYAYCARAWKLKLEGHRPTAGGVARAAGEAWHREHGRAVRRVQRLKALSLCLFIVALIIAAVMIVRWFV